MKILIDARSLGKRPSGIGIYTYNMVREFLKFQECKITLLTDVCESTEMLELVKLNVEILEYGRYIKKNFALFLYYRFIQRMIYKVKPDVFWECNNLVPIRLKNPYGILATTIHDVFPITYSQYYGKKYEWYFRYGLNKTIKNFDLLVYNSKETKEQTEQYFPYAKRKESIVSYIIIPRLPQIEVTDNGSFLYIGNLEKRKGTDILLNAYQIYRKNGGKRELRLGGKVREEDIGELINKIGSNIGGVHYLGYLTVEERDREYASCHCFIFPSRAEGFGIPIVEVMNYFKPIIVSELSIYHEIMGNSILYVQDHGDFDKVCTDLADVMLQEQFTVDRDVYSKVLSRYEGGELVSFVYSKFYSEIRKYSK